MKKGRGLTGSRWGNDRDVWRHVKGRVLANEPTPDLSAGLGRVYDELFQMEPTERLRLAGVLSGNFWLPT